MRLFSLFRFLSIVCITLLVSGASPAPLEELRLYAEAFQETRAAGHILLDRVAPIIAAVQAPSRVDESNAAPPVNDCSVDRHGAPRCFDARLAMAEARSSEPAPIAVRRAALELISTYNGILIELASGRQPQRTSVSSGRGCGTRWYNSRADGRRCWPCSPRAAGCGWSQQAHGATWRRTRSRDKPPRDPRQSRYCQGTACAATGRHSKAV